MAQTDAEIGLSPIETKPPAIRNNKGGRPSKFTAGNALSILAGLSRGVHRDEAARAAGVSRATMAEWLRRGRSGEQPFADFLQLASRLEPSRKPVDRNDWQAKLRAMASRMKGF